MSLKSDQLEIGLRIFAIINEVDIKIYLPEKVIIHLGLAVSVNIIFKGR